MAGPGRGATTLRAWVNKVDSLKRRGEMVRAAELLDSALVIAQAGADEESLVRMMVEKAAMLNTQGESGRALSMLYEAMGNVRRSGQLGAGRGAQQHRHDSARPEEF